MLKHRNYCYFLIPAAFAIASCSGLQPSHEAKFVFQGQVKTADGHPVAGAWVKVRGWETITDDKGFWKEEQIVRCGALREDPTGFQENDAVLIMADGFEAREEKFRVDHPGWFASCNPEQVVAFESVVTQVGKPASPTESTKQEPEHSGGVSL